MCCCVQDDFDPFLIKPDSVYKIRWDILMCALIIYSVVVIPFRIGFDHEPPFGFHVFDWMVDCSFAVDMVVTFNTAYFDVIAEKMIMNRNLIAIRYVSCWFWIDLISTIPFDTLIHAFNTNVKFTFAIRLIRMLRLFRVFKLSRLINLDERLAKYKIPPSITGLLMLLIQIFFVAHWYACFWHFITLPLANDGPTGMPPRTWVSSFGYENSHEYDRYIAALYYIIVTMLTVGYGDIRATNELERVYAIITMLTGGIVFGALISKVARMIDQRNPQAKAFKANMDELKAFMEEIQLPKALSLKAKVCRAWCGLEL